MDCLGKNLSKSIYDNEVRLSFFQISAGLQRWEVDHAVKRKGRGLSTSYSGLGDNKLKVVYIWSIISILEINSGLFS